MLCQLHAAARPALTAPHRLPSPADFKAELRRLNQELLFLFLELLAVLASEPDNSARLLTGIKQLLLNMQFLINALRPVQVRARALCLPKWVVLGAAGCG